MPHVSVRPTICDSELNDNRKVIAKRCEGAVVFSDASGFTALTSRLEKYDNGAERLPHVESAGIRPLP